MLGACLFLIGLSAAAVAPYRAVAAQSTSPASGTTTARPSLASVRPGKAVRRRTRTEAISGRDRLAARVEARPEVLEAQLLQRCV